ncbi:MAG: hypothetical protein R2709_13475 [Marmoricola sp.]
MSDALRQRAADWLAQDPDPQTRAQPRLGSMARPEFKDAFAADLSSARQACAAS